MNKFAERLRASGCKITPQRTLILEILEHAQGHLTVEEIARQARMQQPNLSSGTIYRNLNTLCALELVLTMAQGRGRAYEINRGHHHHLVCSACGRMEEITCCPVSPEIMNLAQKSGFEVKDHNFEITGYCRKCKEGIPKKRD
jgi:Fe2+ or Zn2+ uptake regulation protein